MPNLHQNVSECDKQGGSSAAEFSTSSQHNVSKKNEEKKIVQPSCETIKPSTSDVSKSPPEVTNLSDILMASLKVNKTTEEVTQERETSVPKGGRNARRKRQRQLNLDNINATNILNLSRVPINYGSPNSSAIHEFFLNHVTPLYGNTSTRYLENLSHHPQYQYMQSVQSIEQQMQSTPAISSPRVVNQHAMSVPNTPLIQLNPRGTVSIPSSPLEYTHMNQQSLQNIFFQNITQHPLLSQSYNMKNNTNQNVHQNIPQNVHQHLHQNLQTNRNNQSNSKNSPKHKSAEDKKFPDYISPEEVELGLKNNTLIEGSIRINPKQFLHAFISSYIRDEQDVFIDGIKNRNRALEGDIVVVQFIENENEEDQDKENKNSKQKRGRVVYIKEKVHTRNCIGNLKLMPDKNRQRALFIPRDHRIPRLNIPFTSWPNNFYQEAKGYENVLFLAKIIEWTDTRFAVGKILSNIGVAGNMKTENLAILAQNDLDVTPFGPDIRHLFPRLDYIIPEDEIKLREDCRKLCIFSIDPSNCRDIDDAVSCLELENGNYEVGVHISDVAYYLKENTILDEKVAQKATTIYMVERAYHMLPDELCMLCSLFPGVDKLAFSVFWEITKDGKVLGYRIKKTVINSCSQLAYEHAQAIIEDRKDAKDTFPEIYNGFDYSQIHKTIKILSSLSAIFRNKRFEGGALRIDQPKIAFHLNPSDGLPNSFCIYESKESHQMIEEFMLLANMTVAQRIYEDYPKLAFLRCHPEPSAYMLKELAKSLKPLGIDLDISSAGSLYRSLLTYTSSDEESNRGRCMVLNMLCAKPMTRAKYFCAASCEDDEFHHYALNVPLYTHFTSPIRRYADIMVHRLLAASLKYRETPEWEVDVVRMVASQCNKQKYNAKKAGEMSSELYILKYIEMHSPFITEAVTVDVREKFIDVIIIAMGLNRRIYFNSDFPGQFNCVKNEGGARLSKMEIKWRPENGKPEVKQVIELFSILQVQLHKGDDMIKVETTLIRP